MEVVLKSSRRRVSLFVRDVCDDKKGQKIDTEDEKGHAKTCRLYLFYTSHHIAINRGFLVLLYGRRSGRLLVAPFLTFRFFMLTTQPNHYSFPTGANLKFMF